ncbi:DNA polymerase kappa-like [Syzygium oleosum]|uniref:DNA polymerase kappa-like n=1 Tax=Syzygium oleosum TaxID=219896 RepID=UPI0024B974CD|nr:DNA polymerase kappa-like [Syzygium oleosum]
MFGEYPFLSAVTESRQKLKRECVGGGKVVNPAPDDTVPDSTGSPDELAELLSSDMQKEGLHGPILTLKLKTSSFEVRTRALTLQKYISSRDDIYKYASKLLKAELPISLRLIGLRVSRFKEDKRWALHLIQHRKHS